MGVQGEIYNILGLELPAECVEKDRIYRVNGKTVNTDPMSDSKTDFEEGVPTEGINLKKPSLVIRLLGYTDFLDMKGDGFEGKALVGYALANESYLARATELPKQEEIERLKPRLIKDISAKLGYTAKESDLKIYLLFDSLNAG